MVVESGLNMSLCVVVVVNSFLLNSLRNLISSVGVFTLSCFLDALTSLRKLILGARPARWLLKLIAHQPFLVTSWRNFVLVMAPGQCYWNYSGLVVVGG